MLFLFFEVFFCLARLIPKNSLKRVSGKEEVLGRTSLRTSGQKLRQPLLLGRLLCGPLNVLVVFLRFRGFFCSLNFSALDRRNRAIVTAESLARVVVAIGIASVRWRSYHPRNTEISPHRACVRCAAIRIARLAFIRLTFVPRGTAEWHARVDHVPRTLAISDWRCCPSKFRACLGLGPLCLSGPFLGNLVLWGAKGPTEPETPKNSK